jgi:hypothetical protein
VCENLKLNVGYILFAKNTIVVIIWNTLIFGVFYFLIIIWSISEKSLNRKIHLVIPQIGVCFFLLGDHDALPTPTLATNLSRKIQTMFKKWIKRNAMFTTNRYLSFKWCNFKTNKIVCENLKLNVGYILFAKNTIVVIIWNTLIFGVFYFLLCPFFLYLSVMSGSLSCSFT